MSTRCDVLVKCGKFKVQFYHHTDGYLEYIGQHLVDFMRDKEVMNQQHNDIAAENYVQKMIDDGFIITFCEHGDTEYHYEVNIDKKTIKAYKVHWKTREKTLIGDLMKVLK